MKSTNAGNIFAIKCVHLKKKKCISELFLLVELVLLLYHFFFIKYPYFYLGTEYEYFASSGPCWWR